MSSNDADEEAHVRKLWKEAVTGAIQGKESSMEVGTYDIVRVYPNPIPLLLVGIWSMDDGDVTV